MFPVIDFDPSSVMPSLITEEAVTQWRTVTVSTYGLGMPWHWVVTMSLLFVIPDEGFSKDDVQAVIMKAHQHILKEIQ